MRDCVLKYSQVCSHNSDQGYDHQIITVIHVFWSSYNKQLIQLPSILDIFHDTAIHHKYFIRGRGWSARWVITE